MSKVKTRRQEIDEHKREIRKLEQEQLEYQPTLWETTIGGVGPDAGEPIPLMSFVCKQSVEDMGSGADWVQGWVRRNPGIKEGQLLVTTHPADPKTPVDSPAHKERVYIWKVVKRKGEFYIEAPGLVD